MRYADVEVRRDDRGAPNVQLHGTAAAARASATTQTTAPHGAIALCTPPENHPVG
ncbi:MAG: hypothetical protein WBA89_25755 [Microcoleus sp.]|uniref:hypothetical protein n=1 Tax=Microcoleus sp. TaxID=44472 RepID=UPI003C74836B